MSTRPRPPSFSSTSIKGTCPVCLEAVQIEEPHDRCYKHRHCTSKVSYVYILVKTADKYCTVHYTSKPETQVLGVYKTRKQARRARKVATIGWEKGSNVDEYTQGENGDVTTFKIFEEMVNDNEFTNDNVVADDDDDTDDV